MQLSALYLMFVSVCVILYPFLLILFLCFCTVVLVFYDIFVSMFDEVHIRLLTICSVSI